MKTHANISKEYVYANVSPSQMITTLNVHHNTLKQYVSRLVLKLSSFEDALITLNLDHKYDHDEIVAKLNEVSEQFLNIKSVLGNLSVNRRVIDEVAKQIKTTGRISQELRVALLDHYYECVIQRYHLDLLDEVHNYTYTCELPSPSKPETLGVKAFHCGEEVFCKDASLWRYAPTMFGKVEGFIGDKLAVRFGTGLISKLFELSPEQVCTLEDDVYYASATPKKAEPKTEPFTQASILEKHGQPARSREQMALDLVVELTQVCATEFENQLDFYGFKDAEDFYEALNKLYATTQQANPKPEDDELRYRGNP